MPTGAAPPVEVTLGVVAAAIVHAPKIATARDAVNKSLLSKQEKSNGIWLPAQKVSECRNLRG